MEEAGVSYVGTSSLIIPPISQFFFQIGQDEIEEEGREEKEEGEEEVEEGAVVGELESEEVEETEAEEREIEEREPEEGESEERELEEEPSEVGEVDEREVEKGDALISSNGKLLPKLKKWILAERNLDPLGFPIPPENPHDRDFLAQYMTMDQQYDTILEQVEKIGRTARGLSTGQFVGALVEARGVSLQQMRFTFGLRDAADLAKKIDQLSTRAQHSRLSDPRFDSWARPGLVDLILKSLPFTIERATVSAALKEFHGRVGDALDYLMPGKGMVDDNPSSEPGFEPMFQDPPTPGKGIDFGLSESESPAPEEGIDFDAPEDVEVDYGEPEDGGRVVRYDPRTQADERLRVYVRELEEKLDRLQREVFSLRGQLGEAAR